MLGYVNKGLIPIRFHYNISEVIIYVADSYSGFALRLFHEAVETIIFVTIRYSVRLLITVGHSRKVMTVRVIRIGRKQSIPYRDGQSLTVLIMGKAIILVAIPCAVSIAAFNKREVSACIRICNVYKILRYGRHTVDGIVGIRR